MNRRGGGLLPRLTSLLPEPATIQRWLRSQAKFLSFFLPAAILLVVLVIYPIAATLTLSFLGPDGGFAGLQNYGSVLGSPDTFNSVTGILPARSARHRLP